MGKISQKKCESCGHGMTGTFTFCVRCVCCVPNCENRGLVHSTCFMHWKVEHTDYNLPKTCDWTCWSCNQHSLNSRKQNRELLELACEFHTQFLALIGLLSLTSS